MDLNGWPDAEALASALGAVDGWDASAPAILTRAPGRLDVMGGIADYSGSLVLELPLREATCAAFQNVEERLLTVVSLGKTERRFEAPLDDLESLDYAAARRYFRRDPEMAWAAYVAGALIVARRERGRAPFSGARVVVRSEIPEGKGVASSAALSVASMMAMNAGYDLGLTPREVAFLAQKVENEVAGAPCGIMDPMTAVFGEKDRLLALVCRPAEIQESLHVPETLGFWGVDSGVAHAVSGSDYASVRVGAFMGRRMLERAGPLTEITPSEMEQRYRRLLPETLSGGSFLERFGGTGDSVTEVDPAETYRVLQPTLHPIYEHFRVSAFARLLSGDALGNAALLGELMYQSHASYSACGLGSEGTDRLVALAREAGPERGIYGAKITGGGSGGTVAVLAHRDAGDAVRRIASVYGEEVGRVPIVLRDSSPGALAFGHRRT